MAVLTTQAQRFFTCFVQYHKWKTVYSLRRVCHCASYSGLSSWGMPLVRYAEGCWWKLKARNRAVQLWASKEFRFVPSVQTPSSTGLSIAVANWSACLRWSSRGHILNSLALTSKPTSLWKCSVLGRGQHYFWLVKKKNNQTKQNLSF